MGRRYSFQEACDIARSHGFPLVGDFHALNKEQARGVLAAAKACKYRAPKNANGSRAFMFFQYLQRCTSARNYLKGLRKE